MVEEVTEARAAEAERARLAAEATAARDELTRIMERIGDGFVAFDRDLRYTYANRGTGSPSSSATSPSASAPSSSFARPTSC